MLEYLHTNILPRLDKLELLARKQMLHNDKIPVINLDIKADSAAALADEIDLLYKRFAASCSLNIHATIGDHHE